MFKQLVEIRSQMVEEAMAYLDALAERMAALPSYYPAHLRLDETGQTRFDAIRQMVQVMEDRSALEQWRAEEQERLRRAGLNSDRLAYDPTRARPELDERDDRDTKRPKSPPPPVPWDEHAGARFKRAILLGDPGFGKTWLLRYEARRLACEAARQVRERRVGLVDLVLPVFARLSEVNQYDDPLEDTLVALAGTGCSEAFRLFVREKLESERCVILLDAWDEVPVEVPSDGQPIHYAAGFRQRLGQRLEAFSRQFPQPRLLLTSRIVGYIPSPIPNVQELELLAFEPPQTEAFVQVWFGPEAQMTNHFLTMLRQNHQVRGLARIPLMLALLCRAYQEQHLSFPTRRVELYDRCLRGLLRDWKQEKEYAISDTYIEAMLELLQAVGYTLFAEGYEQFNESILRAAIATWLNNLPSTHEFASGQGHNASSLIAELKRDGILISAGEGREAPLLFLHRTFHEYLTARALAQRANCEGWPTIANIVDKKAWLPVWQEIITLLAGQLRNPRPLLELLADKKKDDYFRHRLGLAALCLPEYISASSNPKLNLVDRISEAAFKVWWNHKEAGTEAAIAHLSRALPALAQVNSQVEGEPLLTLLCKYLHDPDLYIRRSAATALGLMGGVVAQAEVVAALISNLHDSERTVRERAVEALGRMGTAAAQPKVLSALIAALHDPHRYVRERAVLALGQMGAAAAQPEVLSALLAALHDPEESARGLAALALGQMGAAAKPEVLSALLTALHDPEESARGLAALALGQMGAAAAQPEVLSALLAALHDPERSVRERAAEALGQMGTAAAQPEVLSALSAALYDLEWLVRWKAAEALGQMGEVAVRPEVVSDLIAALHDPERIVRESAAAALGQMGAAARPEVVSDLIAALHDPERIVRERAAEALGQMGTAAAQPEVLSALSAALYDPEWLVRWKAALALGQMGAVQPEILSVLIADLHDPEWNVRWRAAEALGSMGVAVQPEILSVLIADLHDPEWNVRWRAVEVLGWMGTAAAQPEVLSALVATLHDPHRYVRERAATALEQMRATAQPKELSALIADLHDPRRDVRSRAAEALGGMGTAQPKVFLALIADLHDPHRYVRERAAKGLGMITQEVRIFRRWWGKVEVRSVDELANQRSDGEI